MVYLCPEPAQPFLYIWVHAPLKRPFPAQQRAQAYGPRTRLRPAWLSATSSYSSLVPRLFSNTGKKLQFSEAVCGSVEIWLPRYILFDSDPFLYKFSTCLDFLRPSGAGSRRWATGGHRRSLPLPTAVPPLPRPSPHPHPRTRSCTPHSLGWGRGARRLRALGAQKGILVSH